jgi:predicted RNA binding protein YcfA (HicA-like mRNA interferase family)
MSKLPRLTGKQLAEILIEKGFSVTRIKGSHHRLRHPDGRVTTVAIHRGEIIGPGLLRQIMRDAKLDRQDLEL